MLSLPAKTILVVLASLEHYPGCEDGSQIFIKKHKSNSTAELFTFVCDGCHVSSITMSTTESAITEAMQAYTDKDPEALEIMKDAEFLLDPNWKEPAIVDSLPPKSIQSSNLEVGIEELANLQINAHVNESAKKGKKIEATHDGVSPFDPKSVPVVQLVNWIIEAAVNSRSRFWDAYTDAYLAEHGEGPPELPMPVLVVNDEIIRVTKAAPEIAGMKTMRLGIYEVYDTDGLKLMPSWIDRIPGFVCYCELQ